MSNGHDYTREPASAQPTATEVFNPDAYSFIPIAAAPDVEKIEREAESREFRDLEPGDHLLFVKGFMGKPEPKMRDGYLGGVKTSWETAQVAVRLGLVGDPQASTLDFFDLPPADPKGMNAYLNASTKPSGENPGFMARKFVHFLHRLGFPFPEGAPFPAEACRLGNWLNRQIYATVELQRPKAGEQPKMDQRTGLPMPPRAQIKLFSYRPANQAPAALAAPAAPARGLRQPTRQPAAPMVSPLAASGLDDL